MSGGDTSDLDAVAEELYGLPASDFTSARDDRAAAARRAGDRELATAIKKLRRPTTSAWLTNQLVRQRQSEITTLLRLGADLRDAQAHLASDELRRFSQQGQQVVTALGREARRLAGDQGLRVGDDVVRDVEETLHAALADPTASAALSAGHLTTALHYAGFGSLEAAEVPRQPRPSGARQAPPEVDTAAAREAQAELASAGREFGEQERRLQRARQHRERLEERVRRASEELQQLRADARQAGAAVQVGERAFRAAERRLARAQRAVDGGK